MKYDFLTMLLLIVAGVIAMIMAEISVPLISRVFRLFKGKSVV